MFFLVRAYDGEGKPARRLEVRPRHLEGIRKIDEHVISAGALLDEQGGMKGSALVMRFDSREALDGYLATEPYVTEGVWERVEVEPMNVLIANGLGE